MKRAIYRSDRDDLEDKIAALIRSCDREGMGLARPMPRRASLLAKKIIELLEEEALWDHIIED